MPASALLDFVCLEKEIAQPLQLRAQRRTALDARNLPPCRGGDVGALGKRAQPGQEDVFRARHVVRSEEHTSELQSLMRISYAVFCLKKKNTNHYSQYDAACC